MESLKEIKSRTHGFKMADYYHCLDLIQREYDISKHSALRVAVLRSYTLEMIEPILKLELMLEGYNPEIFIGDYNQYAQEILDDSSALYRFKPDLILLMIRIDELMPDFCREFGAKTEAEWKGEIQQATEQISNLVDAINRKCSAQIILQNMSLPTIPYWGIYDAQQANGQTRFLENINRRLREDLEANPNTFLWDFNGYLMRKGYDNVYDPKLWYISRNPFRQSAYADLVRDLMRYILSALGRGAKCIVLDLDNTLWGGVIGEDGIDGIALGHDYPGNCYMDFQRELLKLYHRGIILAINSKNNESDAFEVIDKHPYMILRRDNFAAYQINWNDKANNLRILADEINIGIDSMIMIDDNPVECELIREMCPECSVVQLPEKPYLIGSALAGLPSLENIRLTEEDKRKGEFYQSQIERKKLEKSVTDLDGFLRGLGMEMEIRRADKFSIPRISQLTQKTNQFNMTTRRYSEADIVKMIESDDSHVFSVSAKDRFGDSGIIGVFILKFDQDGCHIDTFLLSCRVIGRTIEQSIASFIAEFAKSKGTSIIVGEFTPTVKNKPASDVYEKLNFRKVDGNKFMLDTSLQNLEYSPYIRHELVID